ncbi:transcription factor bHLH52-like [Impatiens glandulifera]|uniref:transcription factor bHLH52-like n=1 Tax=Impatiens glandulifera TaxID=253017 RepID=UPI001FB06E72|nr:transcription factor bHLH52-like [Impatiens glandulifera]
MALNYFSNRIYGSQIQQNTNYQDQSFLTFPPTQLQLPPNPHFSNPNNTNNLTISESFIDPFLPIEPSYNYYNDFTPFETDYYLNPNSPTYNNNNNYLYDHHPSPPPLNPKRQRFFYEDYDGFIPNPPIFFQEFVEEEESSSANVVLVGNDNISNKKKNNNGIENVVSAQSIAARQRRRKISEKTQELGKLIPGGQRMNTAEMFHAAFKHIKFLQAQVGILELMGSFHNHDHMIKEEETWDRKEMAAAVTCPRIQEKLHLKEKCLVPKQVLKSLVNHPQLNSNVASLLEEFILTIA